MKLEYDPKCCTTAKELRQMGLDIDSSVPDCAWVPNYAITVTVLDTTQSKNDPLKIVTHMSFDINEPFRWETFTYVEEVK